MQFATILPMGQLLNEEFPAILVIMQSSYKLINSQVPQIIYS